MQGAGAVGWAALGAPEAACQSEGSEGRCRGQVSTHSLCAGLSLEPGGSQSPPSTVGPRACEEGPHVGPGRGAEPDPQGKRGELGRLGLRPSLDICEDAWGLEFQRPSGHRHWGKLGGAVARPRGLAGFVATLVRHPGDVGVRETGAGGLGLCSHACVPCTLENNVFC